MFVYCMYMTYMFMIFEFCIASQRILDCRENHARIGAPGLSLPVNESHHIVGIDKAYEYREDNNAEDWWHYLYRVSI